MWLLIHIFQRRFPRHPNRRNQKVCLIYRWRKQPLQKYLILLTHAFIKQVEQVLIHKSQQQRRTYVQSAFRQPQLNHWSNRARTGSVCPRRVARRLLEARYATIIFQECSSARAPSPLTVVEIIHLACQSRRASCVPEATSHTRTLCCQILPSEVTLQSAKKLHSFTLSFL